MVAHLNWISSLPALATQRARRQLRVVLDSGLLVSFNNSFRGMVPIPFNQMLTYWTAHAHSTSMCAGQSANCSAPSVHQLLTSDTVTPPDLPIMIVTALYDAYILSSSGDQIIDWTSAKSGKPTTNSAVDGIINLEQYAGATRKVVAELTARRFSISMFAGT